ncbi:hypothetical protein BWQ96_00781 [Gracilariopsis chorda]|uniref:SGNH hydrolase-type esterase domain-containing protein n=1 Tax=Gracilariopsis chorda TaxID=448386 RepID=A0A2V3J4Z0_9FLOR|nr:hypothetical protein BWQ96_00781 [Gracilariopsis chorda]|eukprot:PXF49465.1 hypothetical protein BWQ96_00781 [Gracilariopsis chorda]
MSSNPSTIDTESFYTTYHGHPPAALKILAENPPKPVIWLVGDSTLDNKYWIPFTYQLHPDRHHSRFLTYSPIKRDVSYWLNSLYPRYVTINCAVEATTVAQRRKALLPHDRIVRDHIAANDVLVVSIGGNDVALSPSLRTIFSVLAQTYTSSRFGLKHLVSIFGDAAQQYVTRLVEKQHPSLVIICGLYFPDRNPGPSWASLLLRLLQYNSNPEKLQRVIVRVFEAAASRVAIPGVRVVTLPFYSVLDGINTNHYVQRIEPSEEGGKAMAKLMSDTIEKALEQHNSSATLGDRR